MLAAGRCKGLGDLETARRGPVRCSSAKDRIGRTPDHDRGVREHLSPATLAADFAFHRND